MPKRKPITVGVIGDTHIPYHHKNYLTFLKDTFASWEVERVIHIGDVFDSHALSYHEKHPDSPSAVTELKKAQRALQRYTDAFPEVTVTIGNHDSLPWRKAATAGLPTRAMVSHSEYYGTPPGWKWTDEVVIDGVRYFHGLGATGKYAYRHAAERSLQNAVIGHSHSTAGVAHIQTGSRHIWGLSVGCGVDANSIAMEYGKWHPQRPILGCGIIQNGNPYFIPM